MKAAYNKFKKGSEWRKWDLHLHTPYTNLNGQSFKASDEEFIHQLKENEISVVALTNYFYFKEQEYSLQKQLSQNGITAFLNLELRTTYTNKDGQCCDIHVIFSDDVSQEEIKLFLTKLHLNVNGTKKMGIQLQSNELTKATVEFEHLINVLGDTTLNLENRFFMGFLSRGHGNGRTSSNYETLYENCDFILHSSDCKNNLERDAEFWEKNKRPLFQSSDAHNLKSVGGKFSWIKADPTFEGLKQVMYEPEERLTTKESKPDYKQSYLIIDSIELDDPELWSCKIELNENLNTIIGGRSTGKSSLLASIACKLNNKNATESKNYPFIEDSLQNITINWKDGLDDPNRGIEFYPQSYMNTLAQDIFKRNALVESIIKKKDTNNILSEHSILVKELKRTQENYVSQILKFRDDMFSKSVELSELGDVGGVNSEIQRLHAELEKYHNNFTEDESSQYEATKREIEELESTVSFIQRQIGQLHLLNNIELFTEDATSLKAKYNLSPTLADTFETLKGQFINQWNNAKQTRIHEYQERVFSLNSRIAMLQSTDIYIRGNANIEKNAVATDLTIKLRIENDKLEKIELKSKELKAINDELKSYVDLLVRSHVTLKEEKQKLSTVLHFEESDLAITVNCSFDSSSVESILEEQLNRTKHRDLIASFIETYPNNPADTVRELIELAIKNQLTLKGSHTEQSLLNQVLCINTYKQNFELVYQNDNFDSMSQGKQAFVILKLLLEFNEKTCPVLIDQPEDSLDNRAIYNELVHYLKQKKKERQIILVTHNPNVVVSADAEQVIVANQHDHKSKNLSGCKFEYVAGGIEHSFSNNKNISEILFSQGIREHICEILEGGEDAFKKREQKYQFAG